MPLDTAAAQIRNAKAPIPAPLLRPPSPRPHPPQPTQPSSSPAPSWCPWRPSPSTPSWATSCPRPWPSRRSRCSTCCASPSSCSHPRWAPLHCMASMAFYIAPIWLPAGPSMLYSFQHMEEPHVPSRMCAAACIACFARGAGACRAAALVVWCTAARAASSVHNASPSPHCVLHA